MSAMLTREDSNIMEYKADSATNDFKTRITNEPVLVTGGTGFVAGHIIQQLLLRGYRVRGTVRDMRKPETFAYLSRLQNAAENLELVEINLRNPANHESWEVAFDSVEYVIHTACNSDITTEDLQNDVVEPAIQGTKTILEWCHKSPTVKKLILTSCMNAITDEYETDKKYTEEDWNVSATREGNPYSYCKTATEQDAYNLVSQGGCAFTVASILPGTVLGPHLGGRVNFSHRFLLAFMQKGSISGVPNIAYALSDVRDVARYHIAVMENPEAQGRYICANLPLPLQRILQIIHENFSDLSVPTRKVSDQAVRLFGARKLHPEIKRWVLARLGKPPSFSRKRAQKLGVPLRTPAETVVDTCRYFIESNLVSFSEGGGDMMCLIL